MIPPIERHFRTHASQQRECLFDHLVSASEQCSRHVDSNRACIVRFCKAHNLIKSRVHYTDFGWGFHCHLLVIVEKPIVACKSHDLEPKSLKVLGWGWN